MHGRPPHAWPMSFIGGETYLNFSSQEIPSDEQIAELEAVRAQLAAEAGADSLNDPARRSSLTG